MIDSFLFLNFPSPKDQSLMLNDIYLYKYGLTPPEIGFSGEEIPKNIERIFFIFYRYFTAYKYEFLNRNLYWALFRKIVILLHKFLHSDVVFDSMQLVCRALNTRK